MLQNIQNNSLKVNNYAYQDTITGISEFFHDYNIEFEAHEIPCSIDYPLLDTITDLLGVEYIHEYLCSFTIENDFLKKFSDYNINRLLQGFDKEAEHMLVNLFELVLTNVLGCELLELDFMQLNIPAVDLTWLQKHLTQLNKEEIQSKLNSAMDQIGEKLKLEPEIRAYAKTAIPRIGIRLSNNLETDTLDRIFITFTDRIQKEDYLEAGIIMEDSKLRELMEELKDINSVRRKITRIHDTIHSVDDFIELLEECFYGNEYIEVFGLLNETERTLLKNRILEEAGIEGSIDYIPEKEWQKILFNLY